MKTMKRLILSAFLLVFGLWIDVGALEQIKDSSDTKEVLQEIEKIAEGDLKKVTGKIGEIEIRKGSLTLEELEPLEPATEKSEIEKSETSPPVDQMKVFVDQDTEITDGKDRLELADLTEDMKVKVVYKNSWLGKHVAQFIVVK